MKSTLLRSMFAFSIFAWVAATSPAQDVSKKEKLASDLLKQLHMEKMMDSAFDASSKMQDQMLATQNMSREQAEKARKRAQATMDTVKKEVSWEKIKTIFVKIYADNFDEADLEGMIAFYKTPVGQKWIEKQPQIQAATMQAMGQIMPKIQAAVTASFKDEENTELKATP